MTTQTPRRIAIVGCGSGGPAAALFLARAGHHVTLFERVSSLRSVGAGVLIQPTGQEVLRQLGILEAIRAHGATIHQLHAQTTSGREVLDMRYKELDPKFSGIGLHRATLLHHLEQAMNDEARITIRFHTQIKDIDQSHASHLTLRDQEGQTHGPFDLLILADGATSQLRTQTGIPTKVKVYPWAALWYIGPDHDKTFGGVLEQRVEGPQKLLGFLPTGRLVGKDEPARVSLFWSLPRDQQHTWSAQGLDALKRTFVRMAPHAEGFLQQLVDPAQFTFACYYDVVMKRWHQGRIAVIGDAAHAMSPQMGQGANLALYDAFVLSACINSSDDVEANLALYSKLRRPHLNFYQFLSRWLTPFFQSTWPVGWFRDMAFPLMHKIPPIRKQMLLSTAGLKRGIIRRSFSLPPHLDPLQLGQTQTHPTPLLLSSTKDETHSTDLGS